MLGVPSIARRVVIPTWVVPRKLARSNCSIECAITSLSIQDTQSQGGDARVNVELPLSRVERVWFVFRQDDRKQVRVHLAARGSDFRGPRFALSRQPQAAINVIRGFAGLKVAQWIPYRLAHATCICMPPQL
jgi:hypothetical protein